MSEDRKPPSRLIHSDPKVHRFSQGGNQTARNVKKAQETVVRLKDNKEKKP